MKYYTVNAYGKAYKVRIEVEAYNSNNTLALELVTDEGEPFCSLTVNLPTHGADNETAYVDTNNCPWAEEFILANDIGYPTGDVATSGFCTYPLYHFDIDVLKGE